mmetsp:Transcript_11314/g.24805  ORF Transcript_11314/g.24805 Transcript_11314/m.24805 type:complete len:278 (-) Transcript_11314:40-873(-)
MSEMMLSTHRRIGSAVGCSRGHLHDRDVGAVQPQLAGVLAVPAESQQGVVAAEVGQFHPVADDGSVVPVRLALPSIAFLHATAAVLGPAVEPGGGRLTAPPCAHAVGVCGAVVSVDIVAAQDALLEASLKLVHLVLVRRVVGVNELGHDGVVGADAVGIHASVVGDVGHAPLHVDHIPSVVRRHHVPPVVLRVVPVRLQIVVSLLAARADIGHTHARFRKRTVTRVVSGEGQVRHRLGYDGGGVLHVAGLLAEHSARGRTPEDTVRSGAGEQGCGKG